MPRMGYRLSWIIEYLVVIVIAVAALTASGPTPADEVDRVRAYTRDIEFDYVSWIIHAASLKIQQGTVGMPGYLGRESSATAVSDYLHLIQQINDAESALNKIYADPSIPDKQG